MLNLVSFFKGDSVADDDQVIIGISLVNVDPKLVEIGNRIDLKIIRLQYSLAGVKEDGVFSVDQDSIAGGWWESGHDLNLPIMAQVVHRLVA
jgi:hypothetical protein